MTFQHFFSNVCSIYGEYYVRLNSPCEKVDYIKAGYNYYLDLNSVITSELANYPDVNFWIYPARKKLIIDFDTNELPGFLIEGLSNLIKAPYVIKSEKDSIKIIFN